MLIDTIKKENMIALKNHDELKRNALSIVINKYMLVGYELKAKGKEATDLDLIVCINKTVKELEEELASCKAANRIDSIEGVTYQINLLKVYLPQLMSEEDIKNEILKLEDKSIPSVMKHFKQNFNGKCDMGLVNKVLKSL